MHRTSTLLIALLGFLVLFGPAARAAEKNTANTLRLSPEEASPAATLESAAFLIGDWTANAFGGVTEESWLPPRGDAMIGLFRLVRDGEPTFYEFFELRQEAGSLILRLKHFNAGTLHSWEEKRETTDFELVRVEEDALYFSGLTFRRTGPDTMTAYVALTDASGEVNEAVLPFRKTQLR